MYTRPGRMVGSALNTIVDTEKFLPSIGSYFRNSHGIEWTVDSHLKIASRGTGLTEYPVIIPQNLSDRFAEFLHEVARCTPKVIFPLHTMPTVFPERAHPGGHSIDAWSHPEQIHVFIDAEDVSEVVLAHELAHAWIDLVRGIEDNRVWREREDTARYAQVQFMQSFVLDFAVDQVLDEKGFDRSKIIEDWEVASAQLRIAAERGYRPDNRREAVFMASHLASILVEESRDRLPVKVANLFPVVSRNLPEIFSLAKGMAQSVLDHYPTDRSSAKIAIDQILRDSFAFTDPGLDFESYLIHVRPEINWEMDKNPGWLKGQSVRAKCEIGVAMATVGATSADTPILNRENAGPIQVSFSRPDGSVTESLPLEHAVMPPEPSIARINEMMKESRRAKARMEQMSVMNPNRQTIPPGSPKPPSGPAMPNFGPQLPNVPGFRPRSYSPGLARWLTRVRMEEMLAGEHPYDYCGGNPITFTDPSGLKPRLENGCNGIVPAGQRDILNKCIAAFCKALNDPNKVKKIQDCMRRANIEKPTTIDCFKRWCASNNEIQCSDSCGAEFDITCNYPRGCETFKFTVRAPECANSSCNSLPNPGNNENATITLCNWWFNVFPTLCPYDAVGDRGGYCGGSVANSVFHEVLHNCATCNAIDSQHGKFNSIANCILDAVGCKR